MDLGGVAEGGQRLCSAVEDRRDRPSPTSARSRRWLSPKGDRTPAVLVNVAHLDDDEVYGFLPPHPANPPTKRPLVALMKQARAFGVARSFSRPHVSDDNAFSEALFKTAKYQPDYPDVFASPSHGRAWFQQLVGWYNDDHQHSGLALFTPADVFYGRVDEVAARRQVALDEAYVAHPERFPNGAPVVRRPPAAAHINPLTDDDAPPDSGPRSSPHAAANTPRLDAQLAASEAIPS